MIAPATSTAAAGSPPTAWNAWRRSAASTTARSATAGADPGSGPSPVSRARALRRPARFRHRAPPARSPRRPPGTEPGRHPAVWVLTGGEDHGLLATFPPGRRRDPWRPVPERPSRRGTQPPVRPAARRRRTAGQGERRRRAAGRTGGCVPRRLGRSGTGRQGSRRRPGGVGAHRRRGPRSVGDVPAGWRPGSVPGGRRGERAGGARCRNRAGRRSALARLTGLGPLPGSAPAVADLAVVLAADLLHAFHAVGGEPAAAVEVAGAIIGVQRPQGHHRALWDARQHGAHQLAGHATAPAATRTPTEQPLRSTPSTSSRPPGAVAWPAS